MKDTLIMHFHALLIFFSMMSGYSDLDTPRLSSSPLVNVFELIQAD